jgi:hypothetical protein
MHDLDPLSATGTATTTGGGTVTVTIHSDNEANGGLLSGIEILRPGGALPVPGTGTGENDPNSISVAYAGPGHIATLTFNPSGLAAEGGNVTGGENGVDATNTYFSNLFPGVVFLPGSVPFTVGTSLPNSLAATDVIATPSNMAPSPSLPGQAFWTLGLQFPMGNFTTGKALRFTIGRGEQHASDDSTIDDATGDIWGGGVLIPEGTLIPNGMKFSGTMDDNSTFTGRIVNQIGHGYTPLDGYGLINAEAAAGTPLPPPVQVLSIVSRKIHGAGVNAPHFDIALPVNLAPGALPGIECRVAGATGTANSDHQLVFSFTNPLQSVGSAAVTSGTGSVSSTAINGTDYIVNLSGVTNAQKVTVTLSDISDQAGNNSASLAVTMGVLLGDSTATGTVNSSDVSQVKGQSGAGVTNANFRTDVTASGQINASDVSTVKSQSGTALP